MASALRRPYRASAGAPARPADDPGGAQGYRPGMGRVVAARGGWAIGSGMTLIARLIRLVMGIVVLLIVVAILLRVLGANPGNVVVRDIHDVAGTLVGPFKNLFSIKGPKLGMAVNWGVAALVYLIVGSFIARLIARSAPRGVHPSRPV